MLACTFLTLGPAKHEERSDFVLEKCKIAGVLSVLAALGMRSMRAACHSRGQNLFWPRHHNMTDGEGPPHTAPIIAEIASYFKTERRFFAPDRAFGPAPAKESVLKKSGGASHSPPATGLQALSFSRKARIFHGVDASGSPLLTLRQALFRVLSADCAHHRRARRCR